MTFGNASNKQATSKQQASSKQAASKQPATASKPERKWPACAMLQGCMPCACSDLQLALAGCDPGVRQRHVDVAGLPAAATAMLAYSFIMDSPRGLQL